VQSYLGIYYFLIEYLGKSMFIYLGTAALAAVMFHSSLFVRLCISTKSRDLIFGYRLTTTQH